MILFWVIAGLMILVGLFFVLPSLLQQSQEKTPVRDAVNAAIYKDQLAELEADLRNGTLSPEQFEQGRLDLERNLLADITGDERQATAGNARKTSARTTAIIIGLAVPVLAVGIYLQLSQVETSRGPQPEASDQAAANPSGAEGFSPQAMVESLAAKLQANPQDGQGWLMLGRSYTALGRFSEASQAYAKAHSLVGDDPQLLADYAEALALSNANQDLTGKPTELLQKALRLDPKNEKALWLAGMAAFQKEDFRSAVGYWKPLSEAMPKDSASAKTLKQFIADAEARVPNSLNR